MFVVPYFPNKRGMRDQAISPYDENFFGEGFMPGTVSVKTHATGWLPPVDFVDVGDRFLVFMDAPGMTKDEIHVEYTDGILYLRGHRTHEKEIGEGINHNLERRCGDFVRHFHLQGEILTDEIKAEYTNGILKVQVPKSKKETKKDIPIEVH